MATTGRARSLEAKRAQSQSQVHSKSGALGQGDQAVAKRIEGSAILITGGTGSFGNNVVRKLLQWNPKRVVIFSRDEKKQFDMRNTYRDSRLRFVIGDVRDSTSVSSVMSGIDYVFHAAALKQVPTCEFFPIEAVKTNILGTANVIQAAIRAGVKRLVILSTDKAVQPINAMGMSKALMEKVMIANSREFNGVAKTTILCGVRYGNVLYSRGSILPYFVDLMKLGKPLTVTDGRMTRFLLPLHQAVDLVLYAFANGAAGHIYVRKSAGTTVEMLARAMIKIFEYDKGFIEVGIRAGEKMHETLVTREEILRAESRNLYYDIAPETQGLDYNQYFVRGRKLNVDKVEPYTSSNTKRLSLDETVELLLTLPEIREELKNWKSRSNLRS
ncbi:MAG: polysaccharide biosynthesis protein [Nitrososphaerota archaeon]|nr:polysaccharide biosynthesis protein [Nitrososphaerota archaeon]